MRAGFPTQPHIRDVNGPHLRTLDPEVSQQIGKHARPSRYEFAQRSLLGFLVMRPEENLPGRKPKPHENDFRSSASPHEQLTSNRFPVSVDGMSWFRFSNGDEPSCDRTRATRSKHLIRSLFLCVVAAVSGLVPMTGDAKVIYVSASQTTNLPPDGLSWTTAFTGVQGGLNAALADDEVWVAAATYFENVTRWVGDFSICTSAVAPGPDRSVACPAFPQVN